MYELAFQHYNKRGMTCGVMRGLFWLMVLETLVYNWAAPLVWASGKVAHHVRSMWLSKPLISWASRQREQDQLWSHNSLWGHVPSGPRASRKAPPPTLGAKPLIHRPLGTFHIQIIAQAFPISPQASPSLATTNLFSVAIPFLGGSYKWNYTICGGLWLTSLT